MANKTEYHKKLEKPIIFIGNPRSGTTIISEIVMRHKDLAYPSQWHNSFPKSTLINYVRHIFHNPLWTISGQNKQLNKVGFINRYVFRSSETYSIWTENLEKDLDFEREFFFEKKASPTTIKKARNYFSALVKYQGRKRLAFKLTGPAKIEYLNSIFPDAQFVRIHRKPVPTISSLLKSTFWSDLGGKQLWWTGVYSEEEKLRAESYINNPVAMTALQIKKVSDVADYEINKTRAKVLDVQYGDFIKNPEKTIESILGFCGLSVDKSCMSYFEKNKIYNRNKKDEEYFHKTDLNIIQEIYSQKSGVTNAINNTL